MEGETQRKRRERRREIKLLGRGWVGAEVTPRSDSSKLHLLESKGWLGNGRVDMGCNSKSAGVFRESVQSKERVSPRGERD